MFAVLCDLEAKHGEVTPELLVAEAADPEHPLHHRFEWDDEVAGHRFRLLQARKMILEVEIVDEGGVDRVRAFVPVEMEGGRRHVRVADAMGDYEARRQVYQRYRSYLVGYQRRLQQFKEFEEVVGAIEGLPEELPADVDVGVAAG